MVDQSHSTPWQQKKMEEQLQSEENEVHREILAICRQLKISGHVHVDIAQLEAILFPMSELKIQSLLEAWGQEHTGTINLEEFVRFVSRPPQLPDAHDPEQMISLPINRIGEKESGFADQKQKRIVIFDLDGTVVDTDEAGTTAANMVLEQSGKAHRITLEHYIHYSKYGTDQFMWRIANDPGLAAKGEIDDTLDPKDFPSYDEERQQFAQIYDSLYAKHGKALAFPGIEKILQRIHDDPDVYTAVVTNGGTEYGQQVIEEAGLSKYFSRDSKGDMVFGYDHPDFCPSGTYAKPSPLGIQHVIGMKMGLGDPRNIQTAVMVGDGPNDSKAGHRAGLHTIAVTYAPGRCSQHVFQWLELPGLYPHVDCNGNYKEQCPEHIRPYVVETVPGLEAQLETMGILKPQFSHSCKAV